MQEQLGLYGLLIVTSAELDPVAADVERTVKWSKGTCDIIKVVCHLCFIPLFIPFFISLMVIWRRRFLPAISIEMKHLMAAILTSSGMPRSARRSSRGLPRRGFVLVGLVSLIMVGHPFYSEMHVPPGVS